MSKIVDIAESRLEAWEGMTRVDQPRASTDEIALATWVEKVAPLIQMLRVAVNLGGYGGLVANTAVELLLDATKEST